MENNSQSRVTQELLESNMKVVEDIDPFDQAHEIEPTLTQVQMNIRAMKKSLPMHDFFDYEVYGDSFVDRDINVPIVPRPPCYDGKGTLDYGGTPLKKICRLQGRLNGKLILVAKGRIVADGAEPGVVVHFKKLNKDEFKVVITCEVELDFEVSLPTEEIKTVAEALHGFLAWPKKLVTFDLYLDEEVKKHLERQRMNENKKTNEKAKDNASPSSIVGKVKEKVVAKEIVDHIAGPSNTKEKLNEKDVAKTTWLDKLRVWTYDPKQIDGTLGSIRICQPYGIADFDHCAPVRDRAIKVANNLANRYTDDKLYLIALMEFHKRRGKWTVVPVPGQTGLTEIALCVMRYMALIVSSGKRTFTEKLKNKGVYKHNHLDDLKEEWAEFF
ncbi:hypothetical protein ACFE04_011173 [Oxalis oulophora]